MEMLPIFSSKLTFGEKSGLEDMKLPDVNFELFAYKSEDVRMDELSEHFADFLDRSRVGNDERSFSDLGNSEKKEWQNFVDDLKNFYKTSDGENFSDDFPVLDENTKMSDFMSELSDYVRNSPTATSDKTVGGFMIWDRDKLDTAFSFLNEKEDVARDKEGNGRVLDVGTHIDAPEGHNGLVSTAMIAEVTTPMGITDGIVDYINSSAMIEDGRTMGDLSTEELSNIDEFGDRLSDLYGNMEEMYGGSGSEKSAFPSYNSSQTVAEYMADIRNYVANSSVAKDDESNIGMADWFNVRRDALSDVSQLLSKIDASERDAKYYSPEMFNNRYEQVVEENSAVDSLSPITAAMSDKTVDVSSIKTGLSSISDDFEMSFKYMLESLQKQMNDATIAVPSIDNQKQALNQDFNFER